MVKADKPTFYTLPATELEVGMSTDDGQDILSVSDEEGFVFAEVYTPRPDAPDIDAENRGESVTRTYKPGVRVSLAVFPDTEVDGSEYTKAEIGV